MNTADLIIEMQRGTCLIAIVLGVAYAIFLPKRRVSTAVRWAAVPVTLLFGASVIWGKFYVAYVTSVSDSLIRTNPSKAIQDLSQAVRVDPISTSALYKRSMAYAKSNDHEHALSDIEKAHSISPSNASVSLEFAKLQRDINPQQSLSVLNELISRHPQDFDLLNARGITKTVKGDYSGAVADFQSALAVADSEESRFLSLMNEALPLSLEGHHDDSIAVLERAVKLRPNDAEAISALASEYGQKGFHSNLPAFHEKALALANKALQIDDQILEAHLVRVFALFYLGRKGEAIPELSDLSVKHPGDPIFRVLRESMSQENNQGHLSASDLLVFQRSLSVGSAHKALERDWFER